MKTEFHLEKWKQDQHAHAFPLGFIIVFFFQFIFGCTGSSLLHTDFFPSSSLVSVSGGYSSRSAQAFHCNGFSCCGAKALGCSGSVVVVHKLNCPVACGIFPDQGSNLCPLQLAGGFLTTLPRGKSWDSSSDVQGGNVFEARGSECSLRGRLVGTQGC